MTNLELIPRTPVERPKSGTIDKPDQYDKNMQRFREGARIQAMRELSENQEWEQLSKYIAALQGGFWDHRRAPYRAKFVDNQLARARKDTLALYTDASPTVNIKSMAYARDAGIIGEILKHQYYHHDADMRLSEAIDHALFGVSYAKLNGSRGSVTSLACGMDTVLPINGYGDFQESSAVLYRTMKPIQYFRRRWPRHVEDILKAAMTGTSPGGMSYNSGMMMTEHQFNMLSPAMRHKMRDRVKINPQNKVENVFPIAPLEEYWVEDASVNESSQALLISNPDLTTDQHNYWHVAKPGQRLFPRKRLVVFGGDKNVYDGPGPYWTEKYPFARLALDPAVWATGGISKFRTLLPLNHAMNEIGAGVVDTIRRALNRVYAVKRGAIADADWDRFFADMPGARIRMTPNGNPTQDIHALDAPVLPAYIMQFLNEYLFPVFDRHAGTVNMNAVMGKNQVPGGDTLEQIRDSHAGPIRLESRRIEVFLRECAEIEVSHILQYFTREDRLQILGEFGFSPSDFDSYPGMMVPAGLAPSEYRKCFSVTIEPGSMHGGNRDREQIKYSTMFNQGAISLQTYLSKMGVPDPEGEAQKVQQQQMAIAQAQAEEQGGGRTPRLSRGQRTGQAA